MQLLQYRDVRVSGRTGKNVNPGQPQQTSCLRVVGRAGKEISFAQPQQFK